MLRKILMTFTLITTAVNANQLPINNNVNSQSSPQLSPRAISAIKEFTTVTDNAAAVKLFKKDIKMAAHKYYMAFLYNQESFDAARKFLLVSHKAGIIIHRNLQIKALEIISKDTSTLKVNEIAVLNDYLLKNFGYKNIDIYKAKAKRANKLIRRNSFNFEKKQEEKEIKNAALNKKRGNKVLNAISGAIRSFKNTVKAPSIKKRAQYNQRVIRLESAPKQHNLRFLSKIIKSSVNDFSRNISKDFNNFIKSV